MAHSKEPWWMDDKIMDGNVFVNYGPRENRTSVCMVGWKYGSQTDEEKLANGRLIVAAPKLLAMLKAANRAFYVAGTRKALQEALKGSKELIQEAEGRER